MPATYKYLGTLAFSAPSAAVTLNLATFAVGAVIENASGIITPAPSDASSYGLMIIIDNTAGTGSTGLTAGAAATTSTAMTVPAGQCGEFGPFDWRSWNLVLRSNIGASGKVSVLRSPV